MRGTQAEMNANQTQPMGQVDNKVMPVSIHLHPVGLLLSLHGLSSIMDQLPVQVCVASTTRRMPARYPPWPHEDLICCIPSSRQSCGVGSYNYFGANTSTFSSGNQKEHMLFSWSLKDSGTLFQPDHVLAPLSVGNKHTQSRHTASPSNS